MNDCVFCRILADRSKAAIVHEDDATLAFMDPRQANEGHLLVIPKLHVETVWDMDEETASALFRVVPKIAQALRSALNLSGMSIWQSNGRAGSQEVPHVHVHLMPRHVGDGLLRVYPARVENAAREQLDAVADRIRKALPA
ncbi:HIT family protein [Candidatus Poribacteria bacterium]|nr:HIT family protein [Candidatus Poribacteria bacterium]MBT5534185.1 HIT family protein [Candidatus Poribacteria bacterium]MBT5710325.1 HIT family protein [Candidatus Poribacteria bacterium]MBT7101184.1 HIT family protein [Candidatus Poribacteria bacterium]MBT7808384.1 HIT family protein [Candidatus Poribacteria bacterium]